jgi:hypothetical protein
MQVPLRRQADVFTDLVELQSKLGRDPSERPARASRAITRRNSCSAPPRGHHGAKATTSLTERLALETGERAACPIRAAPELRRERSFGTKAGLSRMAAVVKVCGCRPHDGGAAHTGAGVRKPPREETARRVAPSATDEWHLRRCLCRYVRVWHFSDLTARTGDVRS